MLRLGGEIIHSFLLCPVLLHKILQAWVGCYIKVLPVIQPGPFQLGIIDGKGHRLHQVQPGPCGRTGSGDVAHVLRNSRFHQNNIQNRHGFLPPFPLCPISIPGAASAFIVLIRRAAADSPLRFGAPCFSSVFSAVLPAVSPPAFPLFYHIFGPMAPIPFQYCKHSVKKCVICTKSLQKRGVLQVLVKGVVS